MPFKSPWFYPLAACLILAFLFAFRQNIDYDMGFHLKGGEWILQHHAVPQKDTYTFTVNQNDYQDPHWLYQIGCYLLYQAGGYSAVGLAHLLLILSALGLTLVRMRLSGAPPWALPLLLLPALIATELRFLDRPETLSWMLLILTLLVLDLRLNHQRNFLFLLPLFQLLWVNVEGLFILGWIAMGAYLLTNWFHHRRWDRLLVRYSLLAFLAALFNPYFLKGVTYPFLLLTRLQGSNLFKQGISELQSPWTISPAVSDPFLPLLPLETYRVLSLVILLVIGLSYKKRKFHELILTIAFFGLSVAAIRNIPLFFWVTLPIAAASLGDLTESFPPFKAVSQWLSSRKTPAFVLALFILLIGARVVTGAYYISDRRTLQPGLGLDQERFPVQAADFMVQNHLEDRLLNDFSYGGWLDWRGPSPVFIDGRLEVMKEDFFSQYRDSFYPGGLEPLLDRWGIKLVLFNHMLNTQWAGQLRTLPRWRLLYFDEEAALYARDDEKPGLKPTQWDDLRKQWGLAQPPPDTILMDLAAAPAHPFRDWLEGFYRPQAYPMPLFRLGAFAYENSRFDLARDFFLEMLRRTSGKYYEVYFNLGAAYERLGQMDLAKLCYQKVLDLRPNDPAALHKMSNPG